MLSSRPGELFAPSKGHVSEPIEERPQSFDGICVCARVKYLLDIRTELRNGNDDVLTVFTTSVRNGLKRLIEQDQGGHRPQLSRSRD
jgi:hypothetical protein